MRKKITLLVILPVLLLFSFSNLNAQVYNGDLTLSSQAQVDAFNYTSITGSLTIQESISGNITNLNGLSELYSIGGRLTIESNAALSNVDGLNNLSLIKGNLLIEANFALTTLSGLSNLASVEGYVIIDVNTSLTTVGLNSLSSIGGALGIQVNGALVHINGLSSLSSVGGELAIQENGSLVDVDGLNNLTSVGGDLAIITNPSLANISGLNGLTSITGFFHILTGNNALAHIDGFNSLTLINGELRIDGLPFIEDINGFNSLVSIGGDLSIQIDPALVHINGLSNLSSIGGFLDIQENGSLVDVDGLNNVTSIGTGLAIISNHLLANISGLNGLTSITAFDILTGNNALAHIDGFNSLTSIAGGLEMDALPLIDVNGFNSLVSIGGNLSIQFNPTLVHINGLSSLSSIGGFLAIADNSSLVDVDGLNNLTSVGGGLGIARNQALVHINGLSSLSSIGGDLVILENSSLVDVDGLENLSTVSGDLIIETNIKLNSFCGLLTLFKNNGLAGSYSVSGNAVNPTKQELIDASHQGPVISDVTVNPATLAPPNHKMRDVTVNFTSTDNCGVESCSLTVTSNEPVNGTGDGDTDPDWEIVDDHHVKLRAERAANGNGRIYTITITCTDQQGNASTKTIEVRVAHNITDPQSGKAFIVGSTVNFSGEFWDKPTNKHSAKWLIDDNTSVKGIVTEPTANKNGKVTGSYKFTAAGVYKLQMNTTDQNNIVSYANTNGDLEEIIVVYDPNGGYTYGGGYYNSPAGALKTNPTATGKASYGFAMNYFKNSTNPKGETQFEFKVGDFEFNALNFEYLVISNSMAQFKGTGKIIGGQSGVGFTMTVIDGQLDGSGIDKIRMKIYNKNNGAIIYDNQFGASDAALPTQAVGTNSSIVISGSNSSLTSANKNQKGEMEATISEISNKFNVIAFPNPSTNNFSINVQANANEKISMQVVDMYGRIIEARNVTANSMIRFGDRYRPGTYFVRIIQGKEHKELKLVKLSD